MGKVFPSALIQEREAPPRSHVRMPAPNLEVEG